MIYYHFQDTDFQKFSVKKSFHLQCQFLVTLDGSEYNFYDATCVIVLKAEIYFEMQIALHKTIKQM